ncbi:hypothetical protein IMZ48_29085 [Candidatus Bathyarchaeota archaeon]|nr:hypothetical protein [Candidatus Bathyarchaeota archaeon]
MEIVGDLISSVKENEPNTLRYEWYKSIDESGSPRVTVIEKYVDSDAHFTSS